MNQHPRLRLAAAAALVVIGLAGCGQAPDPLAGLAAASSDTVHVADADADVTKHVKTALRQAQALEGFDVAVVTTKGDVRLTGVLDNQAQIDEAIRIARAADGAHTIHDELTVRK